MNRVKNNSKKNGKHNAVKSILLSWSVMSYSLWTHGLQHSRLLCPASSPRVCSNSCPLSQWHHPTIKSSVIPFSCLQSVSVSRSFLISQPFSLHSQSIGASASLLPNNIQRWFPLGLTGLISLQTNRLSRVFNNTVWKHHHSAFFKAQLSHPYMTTGNTIALTIWNLVNKAMSLLFNMLSMFLIAFLQRNKHLFISWLHCSLTVILESKK